MDTEIEKTPTQKREELIARAKESLFPWVNKLLPTTTEGKRIADITIENDEQLKNCSDLLAIAKKIKKDLGEAHDEEKKPWLEGGRQVDATYKQPLDQVQFAIGLLDPAIINYQDKKQKEADALIALQYAEQQAAGVTQKETGEVVPTEAIIAEQPKGPVRGNMSSTGIKTKMEFSVENEDLVPAHLKTTDLKKVAAEYAIHQKPILGILITEKKSTVSRFS